MGKRKRLMIIGAGALQVPAIRKAKELDLFVAAMDMDAGAPGFQWADECVEVSTNDIPKAIEAAQRIQPDGVMTLASDMPVRTVAAIGNALGLATVSWETALNATDKARMRTVLGRHHVPIPKFHISHSFEAFLQACREFEGCFVVKPADSSGSRGVILANADMNLREVYQYSLAYSSSKKVLTEEWMKGPEVSVETITVNGKTEILAITDKLTTGKPYFVEMGHSIPSMLPPETCEAIAETARAAVEAIGIELGPSHTEIIVTEDGPKNVEIGARLGGDNITTHLVPMATGVDMVELCIRIALGENIEIPAKKREGAAIRYFPSKPGRLVSVHFPEAMTGVEEIVFTKKPGEMTSSVKNSIDRIGYVIARGNTPIQAVLNCERIINLADICVEED